MKLKRYVVTLSVALCALFLPPIATAQEAESASEAGTERPAATLSDLAWLEGSWAGTGIGGDPAGETFSYAGDQQMVGHFWQADGEGGIEFYELITITRDGESLIMRLKHFTSDLTGWEAKEGSAALDFPLMERSEHSWKFGPVTFTLDGPDNLYVKVRIKQADSSLGELSFTYDRVRSGS